MAAAKSNANADTNPNHAHTHTQHTHTTILQLCGFCPLQPGRWRSGHCIPIRCSSVS